MYGAVGSAGHGKPDSPAERYQADAGRVGDESRDAERRSRVIGRPLVAAAVAFLAVCGVVYVSQKQRGTADAGVVGGDVASEGASEVASGAERRVECAA